MARTLKHYFVPLLLIALVFNHAFSASPEPVDSIIAKLNKAIDLKDKRLECELTFNLASRYRFNGKTDLAIEYSQKAFDLATELKDTSIQVHALNILAVNLQQKGEMNSAIDKFNQAVKLAEALGDTILLANSIENLSVVYGSTGITDYPRQLDLLLKSAKLKEAKQAWDMLPGTYKNISTIFRETGDTLNREKYLLKAVDLVERNLVTNPSFKAAVYNEAGRFYTDEKVDLDKAETYFTKVFEISQQLNWKKGIAVSLSNKANIKEKRGDLNEALLLHYQALTLKLEMNDVYGLVNTYSSIGQILTQQKKHTQALKNFEKASDLAVNNKMSNELKENYLSMYKAFRELKNFSAALEFHEKYTALSDSLLGAQHKKTVAELDTKYQTEQKEQQIEKLTVEKQIETLKARQRQLVVSVLGSLLVLIALFAYFIIRQKNTNNKRRESELNQKLLRSQMNPHFIFNALGTIQNYIYNNRADDAAKYLAKFAKLMRNILESSVNEKIPIEQEIETVTNYLTLQQMRSKNNFVFEVTSEGASFDDTIPPMLAQPFIENSIMHAFPSVIENAKIKVIYIFDKDEATIVIEDNGIGINATQPNSSGHKSYAMQLTAERLRLLSKKKQKTEVDINDLSETGGSGTRVTIKIKQ